MWGVVWFCGRGEKGKSCITIIAILWLDFIVFVFGGEGMDGWMVGRWWLCYVPFFSFFRSLFEDSNCMYRCEYRPRAIRWPKCTLSYE